MTRCEDVRNRLLSALRGECPLDVHVQSCPECTERYREMEETDLALSAWTVRPEAVDLWPRLARRVTPSRRSWVAAAAAVLLAAISAGLLLLPPLPKGARGSAENGASLAAVPLEIRQIHRHLAAVREDRREVGRPVYPYVGAYEEALERGRYVAYSTAITAPYAPPSPEQSSFRIRPGYLPRGSAPRKRDATHEAYWTPLGEISIFQRPRAESRPAYLTIVKGGHEFKVLRFVAGGVEITILSEGLPWPELERIQQGF